MMFVDHAALQDGGGVGGHGKRRCGQGKCLHGRSEVDRQREQTDTRICIMRL
jgi:hypothetical protein